MVDGLFFCATFTGRRGGHTPFVQAGAATSDTGAEAIEPDTGSSWEGHSGSSHPVVSSSGNVRPCSPRGGRWIGHWRTTWSTVCLSAPHSQVAEEAIPHLYKQERKRPTPVRRRLRRTQALLGRGTGAGVGDENAESCGVVGPPRIPLVIRPLCCTFVVVR